MDMQGILGFKIWPIIAVLVIVSCKESKQTEELDALLTPQTSEEKHLIDVFLEACLQNTSNFTTMGMTQCTIEAYERWDYRMDSVSEALHNVLPIHIRYHFDESQQKWREYFDAQNDFSDALFSQSEGTMYIPIRVNNQVEILRERALLLEAFLKEAEILRKEGY
jgi:hypothetical protein